MRYTNYCKHATKWGECLKEVTAKVERYSMSKYGEVYCYDHQKQIDLQVEAKAEVDAVLKADRDAENIMEMEVI